MDDQDEGFLERNERGSVHNKFFRSAHTMTFVEDIKDVTQDEWKHLEELVLSEENLRGPVLTINEI